MISLNVRCKKEKEDTEVMIRKYAAVNQVHTSHLSYANTY